VISSGSNGLAGPTGLVIDGSTLYTASIMTGAILRTDLITESTASFASVAGAFEVGALARLTDGNLLAGSPSGSGSIYLLDGDTGAVLDTYASGLGQIGGIAAVPEPTSLAGLAATLGVGFLLMRRRMP